MKTRVVVTIMMVFFVGFVGVVFMVQQANAPVIREIRDQQLMVLDSLAQLERRLDGAADGSGSAVGQASLDRRLAGLDRKVETILDIFRDVSDRNAAQQPPAEDYETVHEIPIEDSPVLGRKDAPVTIVEFIDFQCPYCAKFHPGLLDIYNAYPEQVKIVMKNFPLSFHKEAMPAAMAALAAKEQGRYWEMADLLLSNFQNLSEDNFVKFAKELGLDGRKFKKDYEERQEAWKEIIVRDMTLGSKIGVRGTPSFYLNGRKTERPPTLDAYRQQIDQILANSPANP